MLEMFQAVILSCKKHFCISSVLWGKIFPKQIIKILWVLKISFMLGYYKVQCLPL